VFDWMIHAHAPVFRVWLSEVSLAGPELVHMFEEGAGGRANGVNSGQSFLAGRF
jgi:hypothetical protein